MPFKILTTLFVFSFIQNLNAQRRTQSLSEFKQTEFLPILEHQIHLDKNAIYCPTLLLVWDGLRNALGGSIEVDSVDRDLYLFNRSKDFENTLLKNEYLSSFKVTHNSIYVKAEFKKLLPLMVPMTGDVGELVFDRKEVASFSNKGEGNESAELRYYKDDNHAVVSLLLKDPSQEILLFKTEIKFRTLSAALRELEENIKAGDMEKQSGKNRWKFDFSIEDKLVIPKIKFDIKTDYPAMEQKMVHSGRMRLDVMELTQQIAFSLNEKGVEIESSGLGEVVFSEPVQDEERKPKKIIFDAPFFIVVKRKERANPYLMLWVANSELMK
jgi:hypothetical protein